MSDDETKPTPPTQPEASGEKSGETTPVPPQPTTPIPSPDKPTPTPPAPSPDKPAPAPAPTPSPPSPDKPPAPKPAVPPKPPEEVPPPPPPPPPPKPGIFGNFLTEKGIESTPLPLSSGVETMEVKPSDLPQAIKLLRELPETKLDYLVAVSGVDSPDTFDSVYHLWSYTKQDELVVKVRLPKSAVSENKLPEVPSLAKYWPTADWHERETYDLVGIRYTGHPYLRRILNPWDWEGHPLRRDYKQPIDALNDKNPDSMR